MLRRRVLRRRRNLTDKDRLSEQIFARLERLSAFANASVVLFYVHAGSEVRTQQAIQRRLAENKPVAVPFCQDDELRLVELHAWNELEAGAFGVLELKPSLRSKRIIQPQDVDCALVPGVAFDRRGGRLGHGKGYYDRLLARAPANMPRIGLAYECQLVSDVPVDDHDVWMTSVVTESAVYPCS